MTPYNTHEDYLMFICERDEKILSLSDSVSVSVPKAGLTKVIDRGKTEIQLHSASAQRNSSLPKFLQRPRFTLTTHLARYTTLVPPSGVEIAGYILLKAEDAT